MDGQSMEFRPLCLVSVSMDNEYSQSFVDDRIAELRAQSPESVESESECRPLSPDSPVPHFRCHCTSYNVDLSRYGAFSPESMSAASDWEYTDLCLENQFEETRPDSPESVFSSADLERLFSNRPLSPESISSDFDSSLLQEWLADFRPSSPESVASVEQQSVSPHVTFGQLNIQHCDYYLQYSQSRPESPISTLSDVDYYGFCLEELFNEERADSPDSVTSHVKPHEPTLSVFVYKPVVTATRLSYADVVRGVSHHVKQADPSMDGQSMEFRPLWPLSVSTDNEYTQSFVDDWIAELRAQSPESVESESECRPLSPDSPVPHFRCHCTSYNVDLSRYGAFSPESVSAASDWEYTDLCLENQFEETRPDSPESVFSSADLERLFSNRPLSPESISSDFDLSLLQEWLADFRPSSPESVASVEQQSVSPHVTFGQLNSQHCEYYLQYSQSRLESPISTLSDVDYNGFWLEELFNEDRADSPDSFTQVNSYFNDN
ncbi:hypothetical protein LDENG_00114730, partial [Lucifuga dentata]